VQRGFNSTKHLIIQLAILLSQAAQAAVMLTQVAVAQAVY
jgi:hypothetical protein